MIKMYVDTSNKESSQEIISFILNNKYALSINTADERIYICDEESCLTEDIYRLHFITRARLFKQVYRDLKKQFRGDIIKSYATPITALDNQYREELEKGLAEPKNQESKGIGFEPN
jgi:hypothetical protein